MSPVWVAFACGAFLGTTVGVVTMGALVSGKLGDVAAGEYARGRRAGIEAMSGYGRRVN